MKKLKVEEWFFIAFIATLSFANFLQFRVFNLLIQLSDFLFLSAVIVFLFAVALKRGKIRWSWLYPCLAAYATAVILSAITSANPAQSAVKSVGKFYLIAIAFLTFNLVVSVNFLKLTIKAWLVGVSVTLFFSLSGIILFYFGLKNPAQNFVLHPIFGSLPAGNYPRVEGFFNYPAMLCNFLSVSWMLAILSKSAGWLKSGRFWIFSIALWIVDFFTLTPGLGGIFFGTGYFLRKKFKEDGKPILSRLTFAVSLFIAAGFLFVASVTFFAYTPNGSKVPLMNGEITPSHRARAWRASFETFRQNPVFGRGVGEPVAQTRYKDPSGFNQLLTDAHNTYLSLLGETGLAGFLTFFSIIGFVTFGLLKKHSESDFCKLVKFCLLIALFDSFFYQSLTGSYEDARHLWVLFGLAAAANELNFDKDSLPVK